MRRILVYLTPLPGPSRGRSSLLAGGLLASALCPCPLLLPLAVLSAVRLLARPHCSGCGRFLSLDGCSGTCQDIWKHFRGCPLSYRSPRFLRDTCQNKGVPAKLHKFERGGEKGGPLHGLGGRSSRMHLWDIRTWYRKLRCCCHQKTPGLRVSLHQIFQGVIVPEISRVTLLSASRAFCLARSLLEL